jgi:hypothetical protein
MPATCDPQSNVKLGERLTTFPAIAPQNAALLIMLTVDCGA